MVSGEKRNCEEENALEKINTILLDVEGTTTSISFVKDCLFPYVRENLKTYIDSHWDNEEFKADLTALKEQAKKDEESKIENFSPIEEGENEKESLLKNILWQMDLDRKTTALKQLQGHIWREGYENGKLKGHVYSEVANMFKKWCENGLKIYIYSSGSVEAQKLLFKNSESGDLLAYISGHFDTEVGPKTEESSYMNIAKAIGCGCGQILFLTDVFKEAAAADKAGMQVTIIVRDGNVPLTDDEKKTFTTVTSFKELVFENSNKKKKISDEENNEKESNLKAENTEKTEVKNGDIESMDVETNEATSETKEDCKEKTENSEQGKTDSNIAVEKEDKNEAEVDNIDVDVDDSKAENSVEEKVVSSSVDDKEVKDESTNGEVKEASEEEKKTEDVEASKEDNAVLKEETETPVSESNANNEMVEEPSSENSEVAKEEEKVVEKENDEKNVNGHENGTIEETDAKEAPAEVNGEATEKAEDDISETVSVSKAITEEQADSTIEVTA